MSVPRADTEAAPGSNGAPDADTGTGPPDDIQELRQEIEQTREEIGQTVEQLAAKADIKAQAKAKAAELKGRVRSKTAQARMKAPDVGSRARGQVADKASLARQKAAVVGNGAKTRLQARTAPVWDAVPEPLKRAGARGADTAKQRRVPLAVASAALIAGCLAMWWWRKR